MNSWMKIIFAACALATMSGCTGYGVTFESAPGTELAECNPALVGNWRTVEGERNAPEGSTREFLSVSANCARIVTVSVKQEAGSKETKVDDLKDSKEYKIQFANVDNLEYAVITPKETSFEIYKDEKTGTGVTLPSGKIIYQINKGKDGVILRSVDLDKTAQLILKKQIDGQLYIDEGAGSPRRTSNVFVRGDAKQIAQYLSTLDLYSNDRMLLVPASPEEQKLIKKALKDLGRNKKHQ